MKVAELKEDQATHHGLGGHDPPKEVVKSLKDLNKNLVLLWNKDDGQWEIYLNNQGLLNWQKSCPVKGLTITPGVKTWLQKMDISRGGRLDVSDREKIFLEKLYQGLDEDAKRLRDQLEEVGREVSSVSKVANRLLFGSRQVVVPAGPVVGYNNGVPIRAYEKKDPFKKVILKDRF